MPDAGEHFRVVENEREARQLAGERAIRAEARGARAPGRAAASRSRTCSPAPSAASKELNLVVKADVAGSLEALADEIARLPHEQVQVNVIRDGVGGISESDVMLASASDALIIGFNVRPVGNAAQVADREGVEIRTYSVIYNIVEELRAAMEGLLEPEEVEETVGTAEVRADLPRLARRHDRRLLRDRRRDPPRRAVPPGARRHRRLRRPHRLAAALQGGRARGRRRASSAASCSRTTPT